MSDAAFEIRLLAPEQATLLHELLEVYAEAFGEDGIPPRTDVAYLGRLLGSGQILALVALQAGRVVGGLSGYVLPRLARANDEFYLYDLAVAEHARRRGIARALIDALQAIAKDRNYATIYVQAHPEDTPATALYTHYAEAQDVVHFELCRNAALVDQAD